VAAQFVEFRSKVQRRNREEKEGKRGSTVHQLLLAHLSRRSSWLSQLSLTSTGSLMARRGAFIVFEGLDRSGKSTQVARLVAGLNSSGVNAVACRFPGEPFF
jgi:polyphosphate kinase 2 (PPK2 family)